MKYTKKILRLFSIALILSLLVITVPAAPVQAFGSLTVVPDEGSIGDSITIAGEGFNVSTETTDRYAIIYFSNQEATLVEDIDTHVDVYKIVRSAKYLDEEGEFLTTIIVPDELDDGGDEDDYEDVVGGTYYFYLCYYNPGATTVQTRIRAVAEFTIIGGGEITLDLEEGPVGIEVEITGTDFSADEEITIEYDGDEVDIEDGDDETDSDGEFVSVIFVPESTAGDHTITVIVSGSEVEAEFTVEPEIFINPTSGEANTTVTVTGTGFGRRNEVIVYFNNVGLATITASSDGSFDTTFDVPELEAGIYNVEAEDEDENTDKAKFTVTVAPPPSPPTPSPAPSPPPSAFTASISPNNGPIGAQLGVSGAGFKANGAITIKYDDEAVAGAIADSNGMFLAIFNVPAGKHGGHTVTVSDGINTEKLTFTVESMPPSVPLPLLPEMGVKVKSPIAFDWKDVIDDSSPVIYSVQIATSEDFSAASIVLEKKELTKSEYTITEEEELKLVGQEAPYYWRIRAIDGASNEGEWTGAGEFYVAPSFGMPSWVIYTLFGLGGLLLFALGYWLGRRTAYYY